MSEPYDPSPRDTSFYPSRQHSGGGAVVLPARQGRRNSASQPQPQPQSLSTSGTRHPPLSSDELQSHGPDPQRTKIEAINAELDRTKNILHHNIESIVERGQRLDHLDQQTQALSVSAQTFNTQAAKTRRQFWWKDKKWTIIIAFVLILIICGIVGGAVKGSEK
ncbi:hypothetical protein I317_06931 [Kwoniella heveanensis CBS 569]|nr:hypothetical protein I317_06931 [Kwoniella heveanensis CBS 569]